MISEREKTEKNKEWVTVSKAAFRQRPKPRVEDRVLVQLDFEAMVELFGSFETSRFSNEHQGLMLCDGGTDAALENYALLLPGRVPGSSEAIRDLVRKGLDFFAEKDRSHIWPIFPGLPEGVELELDHAGVCEVEDFYGMVAEIGAMDAVALPDAPHARTVEFEDDDDAKAWADATWLGFDSGEPAPDGFINFTKQAMASEDLILLGVLARFTPEDEEEVAATGMLCTARDLAGIYYIATHPKFRRRGLAMHVMKGLMERAKKLEHSKVSLLATPEGRPLYHRCGFHDTCIARIRMMGEM